MHSITDCLSTESYHPLLLLAKKLICIIHDPKRCIAHSRTKQTLFLDYGSESVILNRNHDAAASVNPIPRIHKSEATDSRIRFCGFVPFSGFVPFGRNRIRSFLLRSRICGFAPE
ncbi:hypothetical protein AVEN_26248-1 [Araneus ventricosus]|uniref:Uncharacterized protein n=1 Tax=Araneus ventricosus TaxID=182803 RepID=A0A4Y2AM21_ARAVE|nr:hypothetical protein AVEN_26248-1 [Araneus ventricosus]